MHLGMSGSFRVLHGSDETTPGEFHHERGKLAAHDHVVFHMSNGAIVTFNDPRRFGFMKLIARDELDERADAARARARAARQRVRRRDAGAGLRRQEDLAEGRAARPARRRRASATSMSARRCTARICRRSARPRPSRREAARRTSARDALVDAIKAVLNDAIKAGGSSLRDHRQTDGELGYFQHHFRVYDREGETCPTPRLQGHDQAHRAGDAGTFFCPVCQK